MTNCCIRESTEKFLGNDQLLQHKDLQKNFLTMTNCCIRESTEKILGNDQLLQHKDLQKKILDNDQLLHQRIYRKHFRQ